ncbi:MAG: FAD-dependent oxidoreductase, partial [Bacteriovoracaceae bacterium]|nr:FAD-dependent oxidoreductase [Bacteriovoracaceae bacterium]
MSEEQISIKVDGADYQVAPGQTIKEALTGLGIEVPSFCYDSRLKPFTSCFLCVVEVEGARNLLPSCSTQATAGMVINTKSERVKASRHTALELILGTHGGDCLPPCQQKCPAHTDIQGYLALIAQGDFINAVKLIKKSLALPFVCGSICPHPCEGVCRRERIEDPVAIRLMKNLAARVDLRQPYLPPVAPATNQKAAIIGGGPAGLAAAYYLRQQGHQVTIFEPLPQLGGMARYGIPRFRLPWPQLDAEIDTILALGIEVKQQRWGEDFTLDDLRNDGFKAILIAVGASVSKDARIEGTNNPKAAPYVIGGIDFLRQVVLQKFMVFPQRAAVIGGGDVAMDCARVARRLGADVEIIYRR